MAVTQAQARRVIRRSDVSWHKDVEDPRDARGQRHAHHGMLSLLVAAFASGRPRFRGAEGLSEDMGPRARRRLGISRRVSDTPLYQLVTRQQPKGLRETVARQVRELVEQKVVGNDLFPVGVLSVDGKCCWSSTKKSVEGAKESADERTGLVTASLTSLRAVLTSSRVRPCLDMELIRAKTGEAPAFRKLLPRLCARFRGLIRIVTTDAGLTCRENALVVLGQGLHYLFALKGNQQRLHQLAQDVFAGLAGDPPRVHTADRRNGATLFRELRLVRVADVSEVDFPGAIEFWQVRQTSTPDNGGKGTIETRYFISSAPADMLTPTRKLELVRLHWGIENGQHWTADVVLKEDTVRPCEASRDAIEVLTWMRIIAYNLLAAWRAKAPLKDRRPISWARAAETLRDCLIFALPERAPATLA